MAGRQARFRDVEDRLRELSARGDPLEKLAATVAACEEGLSGSVHLRASSSAALSL